MTRELTRKGAETRGRIVAGAAAEVRERGVEEVRLEDVMARTGTSKSQLFHYFPAGKEELLLAVAEHEAGQVIADQEPILSDLTSWANWQAWRDLVVARYLAQGTHCPLNGLLGQSGRRAPAAQAVVTRMMLHWQEKITAGVRHMQSIGEIGPGVDAEQVGRALLAGLQGGVVMMLATGRIEHLEAALDFTLGTLRAGAGTPAR
jgi:AcrR family transcriptional regulator